MDLRYNIDNTARLTLQAGDTTLTLGPAQVNELVEFLGAISYKALAQRVDVRAGATGTPAETAVCNG